MYCSATPFSVKFYYGTTLAMRESPKPPLVDRNIRLKRKGFKTKESQTRSLNKTFLCKIN